MMIFFLEGDVHFVSLHTFSLLLLSLSDTDSGMRKLEGRRRTTREEEEERKEHKE